MALCALRLCAFAPCALRLAPLLIAHCTQTPLTRAAAPLRRLRQFGKYTPGIMMDDSSIYDSGFVELQRRGYFAKSFIINCIWHVNTTNHGYISRAQLPPDMTALAYVMLLKLCRVRWRTRAEAAAAGWGGSIDEALEEIRVVSSGQWRADKYQLRLGDTPRARFEELAGFFFRKYSARGGVLALTRSCADNAHPLFCRSSRDGVLGRGSLLLRRAAPAHPGRLRRHSRGSLEREHAN
jgi:hypothetical protein